MQKPKLCDCGQLVSSQSVFCLGCLKGVEAKNEKIEKRNNLGYGDGKARRRKSPLMIHLAGVKTARKNKKRTERARRLDN